MRRSRVFSARLYDLTSGARSQSELGLAILAMHVIRSCPKIDTRVYRRNAGHICNVYFPATFSACPSNAIANRRAGESAAASKIAGGRACGGISPAHKELGPSPRIVATLE